MPWSRASRDCGLSASESPGGQIGPTGRRSARGGESLQPGREFGMFGRLDTLQKQWPRPRPGHRVEPQARECRPVRVRAWPRSDKRRDRRICRYASSVAPPGVACTSRLPVDLDRHV